MSCSMAANMVSLKTPRQGTFKSPKIAIKVKQAPKMMFKDEA